MELRETSECVQLHTAIENQENAGQDASHFLLIPTCAKGIYYLKSPRCSKKFRADQRINRSTDHSGALGIDEYAYNYFFSLDRFSS